MLKTVRSGGNSKLLYRYFPKGEVQGSPVITDQLIVIGARDYNVYAIDRENGYCHWNKSFQNGWGLSNTVFKDTLFIAGADERKIICVNEKSGSEFWNKPMEFLIFGNLVFSQKMFYVGTTNGKLHGFDRISGERVWQFETEEYLEKDRHILKMTILIAKISIQSLNRMKNSWKSNAN